MRLQILKLSQNKTSSFNHRQRAHTEPKHQNAEQPPLCIVLDLSHRQFLKYKGLPWHTFHTTWLVVVFYSKNNWHWITVEKNNICLDYKPNTQFSLNGKLAFAFWLVTWKKWQICWHVYGPDQPSNTATSGIRNRLLHFNFCHFIKV